MGFGKQLLNTAVGGLAGGVSQIFGIGNRNQRKQQAKLNEQAAKLNYQYGEKSAENAFARQMKMYERTYQDESPLARRQQLEDAGLSVGLMYGGGGMGGGGMGDATTVPQGSGAQGLQAGQASKANEQQAMSLELARLASEVKLNESQAEKNIADANLTSGEKTELTKKSIEQITENIENSKVQRKGWTIDNSLKQIELEISDATKGYQIEIMNYEVGKIKSQIIMLAEEIASTRMDNRIKRETMQDVIEQVNATLTDTIYTILERQSNIAHKQAGTALQYKEMSVIDKYVRIAQEGNEIRKDELQKDLDKITIDDENADADRKQRYIIAVLNVITAIAGGGVLGLIGKRRKQPEMKKPEYSGGKDYMGQ